MVVGSEEEVPSMRRKPRSCAPVGADGPGCHGHSHKTPCSLAPRVRERGRRYCGTHLPSAGKGKGDIDQGGLFAHAVCVQETSLQPANSAPCWHLSLPAGQWWLGSGPACARQSPAHSAPDAPRVELVEGTPLGKGSDYSFGSPNWCLRIYCGLCLTFALSRQMMR